MALPLLTACTKDEEESYGSLYGVVTDSKSGEPLDGVTLTLSPGGVSKITGSDGMFEYTDLTPQQYTITAQKSGWATNRKTVTAVVGEKTNADIRLTHYSY